MSEYYTPALVLDKEPWGEYGLRIHLLTEELGRITARAISARKITSKLSAHLEPKLISAVRLVEKNGVIVVDSLRMASVDFSWDELNIIKQLAPEYERDEELWQRILEENTSVEWLLAHYGYDPAHANCMMCGYKPETFIFREHDFSCKECLSALKLDPDEVLLF